MGRDLRDVYRSDRTCCLSIPLFHQGIYSALALNVLFACFMGIMAVAGPGVPSLVRPNAVSVVFAVSFFAIAAFHLASIWAVARNKHTLFQNMFGISTVSVVLVLLLALVIIIVSAANHGTSVRACLAPLVGRLEPGPTLVKICDVTLWIQTGILSGAWFIVSVVECYLFLRQRVYLTLKMEDALEDKF